MRSYYEILGIEKTASEDEIKRAARKKLAPLHPDKNEDKEAAEFKEIVLARDVLLDQEQRALYDKELAQSDHEAKSKESSFGRHSFYAPPKISLVSQVCIFDELNKAISHAELVEHGDSILLSFITPAGLDSIPAGVFRQSAIQYFEKLGITGLEYQRVIDVKATEALRKRGDPGFIYLPLEIGEGEFLDVTKIKDLFGSDDEGIFFKPNVAVVRHLLSILIQSGEVSSIQEKDAKPCLIFYKRTGLENIEYAINNNQEIEDVTKDILSGKRYLDEDALRGLRIKPGKVWYMELNPDLFLKLGFENEKKKETSPRKS